MREPQLCNEPVGPLFDYKSLTFSPSDVIVMSKTTPACNVDSNV